jgi:hypothetical protein|tara:strand:- start:622 stop:828 length:207 start_codon:yes stop_codon:yes gene_type:complete
MAKCEVSERKFLEIHQYFVTKESQNQDYAQDKWEAEEKLAVKETHVFKLQGEVGAALKKLVQHEKAHE